MERFKTEIDTPGPAIEFKTRKGIFGKLFDMGIDTSIVFSRTDGRPLSDEDMINLTSFLEAALEG